MPTICTFYGMFIKMYWDDHAPPHFHVEYGDFRAVYVIATLELTKGSLEDIAFGLEPCAPPVIHVRVADNASLHVEFADGIKGVIKFLPSHLTGVFDVLRSPTFFAQVGIEHGAVTWPGELNLAPDAMYDAIKEHSVWVLQ